MPVSDSVTIFAEGTFEEQIQELVNYLARGLSEEERISFIRPFQEALVTQDGQKPISEDEGRRRNVIGMVLDLVKNLGDGNDREIEGFFNLLFAHLLVAFPPESPEARSRVTGILRTFDSIPASEHSAVKYRILSNLFNALPRTSALRFDVYQAILKKASETDDLEILQLNKADIEKWLSEWDITQEQKSQFLKTISDTLNEAGSPEAAYSYLVSYLRSLPANSPDAAVEAIATALRLPSIFNFDSLLKVDAIHSAKNHPLFGLLKIFLSNGLAEYKEWESKNGAVLNQFNLDKTALERKIRLLTLASLGSRNIGKDLPYSEIASALQIEEQHVERWVIDVIRANLLSGKLSQPTRTLHVTRSTWRVFGREEWQALEKRLLVWKAGLAGVLEVVAGAKRSATAGETTAQPAAQSQAA